MTVTKHPGYSRAWTSTHDWKGKVGGPYHWSAYRRLDDGQAEHVEGWTNSMEEAKEASAHAL